MANFRKGQKVRYSGLVPQHTGQEGVVVGITQRGWIEVQFPDTPHLVRCAQANLTSADPRSDLLAQMFDLMTEYLVDECPDDANWEDFDPDVDSLRSEVILMGGGQ